MKKAALSVAEKVTRTDDARPLQLELHTAESSEEPATYATLWYRSEAFPSPDRGDEEDTVCALSVCELPPEAERNKRVRLRLRTAKRATSAAPSKDNGGTIFASVEFSLATLSGQLRPGGAPVALCPEVSAVALPDFAAAPTGQPELTRALLGGLLGRFNPIRRAYAMLPGPETPRADPASAVRHVRDTVLEPLVAQSIPLSLLLPATRELLAAAEARRRLYHRERLRRRDFASAAEAQKNGHFLLRVRVARASALQGDPDPRSKLNRRRPPAADRLLVSDLLAARDADAAGAAEERSTVDGARMSMGLPVPVPRPAIAGEIPTEGERGSSSRMRTLANFGKLRRGGPDGPAGTTLTESDAESDAEDLSPRPNSPSQRMGGRRRRQTVVTVEARRTGSKPAEPWETFLGQTANPGVGSNPSYMKAGALAPRRGAARVLDDGCTLCAFLPVAAAADEDALVVFRVWQLDEGRCAWLLGEASAPVGTFEAAECHNDEVATARGALKVHTLDLTAEGSSEPCGKLQVHVSFTLHHAGPAPDTPSQTNLRRASEAALANLMQGLVAEEKDDSDDEDAMPQAEAEEAPAAAEQESLATLLDPDLADYAERLLFTEPTKVEEWMGDGRLWDLHALDQEPSIEAASPDAWLEVGGFQPAAPLPAVVEAPLEPPQRRFSFDPHEHLNPSPEVVPRLHTEVWAKACTGLPAAPADLAAAAPANGGAPEADFLTGDVFDGRMPPSPSATLSPGNQAPPVPPPQDTVDTVMRDVTCRLTALDELRAAALLHYRLYGILLVMTRRELERWNRGELFRTAMSKMDRRLQATPMNLHVHLVEMAGGADAPSCRDLVTCGAATTHAFGYKPGGLVKSLCLLHSLERDIMGLYNTASLHNWEGRFLEESALAPDVFEQLAQLSRRVADLDSLRAITCLRRVCTLSQALSTCAAAFATRIHVVLHGQHPLPALYRGAAGPKCDEPLEAVAAIWGEAGFLVYWEGLLSSAGKEQGMIEDVVATLAMLHDNWVLRLRLDGDRPAACRVLAKDCVLELRLPTSWAPRFQGPHARALLEHGLRLRPVLFTQGIDLNQSVANLSLNLNLLRPGTGTKETGPAPVAASAESANRRPSLNAGVNLNPIFRGGSEFQSRVNQYGLSFFQAYLAAVCRVRDAGHAAAGDAARAAVAALSAAVQDQNLSAKNTAVLTCAETASDELGGGRVTFCKSGKDRTAMSITLEQTRSIYGVHGDPEEDQERLRVTNVLRVGTRLEVAEKNIGKPKYSFNALQRRFMPKEYQAPLETIQDYVTSALNAES